MPHGWPSAAAYNLSMSSSQLVVLIDGACPMCRRTARTLGALDWLHRLSFADGSDARVRERLAPGLDEATALAAMHVVAPDGSRRSGYDGFLRIAAVVPLLWVLGLVGRIPFIAAPGRRVYRYVAANRTRHGRCTDAVCSR